MNVTFDNQHGSFRVRDTREDERVLLKVMIEDDPDHRHTVEAETFTQRAPNEQKICCEDSIGPVFYLRITRVLRVDIQFDTTIGRERTRAALLGGFPWLMKMGREAGFKQMIFDSTTKLLMAFCRKRLGFRNSPNELVCELDAPRVVQAPGMSRNMVPQVSHAPVEPEAIEPDWVEG